MTKEVETVEPINLLCVVGMSPAVVTETVYGLCITSEDPETMGEIVVITTTRGRESLQTKIAEQVLAMAREYPEALARLPIDESGRVRLKVMVPEGRDGDELSDVRTEVDNALMADLVHSEVQRLTKDGMPRLHASLAGGRKTMSYFLGNAMTLLGRDGDRLSHVLVSENAESCRDFYFPPANSMMMQTYQGQEFDASKEEVEVFEIPYIRLRSFQKNRRLVPASYVELIAMTDADLFGEQRLIVDLEYEDLEWNNVDFNLTPVQHTLYMVLAAEHFAGRTPVAIEELFKGGKLAPVLTTYYLKQFGDDAEGKGAFFMEENDYGNCKAQISQMKRRMHKVFPEYIVSRLSIKNVGPRGNVMYTLGIDRNLIEIRGADRYEGEPLEF